MQEVLLPQFFQSVKERREKGREKKEREREKENKIEDCEKCCGRRKTGRLWRHKAREPTIMIHTPEVRMSSQNTRRIRNKKKGQKVSHDI